MEVSGKINRIDETQQVSEKFKKREFVLEISNNPAYVEKVLFTCLQDNVSKLDNVNAGDEVTISYNLKGREWTSPKGEVKVFNTLDAWKIESNSSQNSEPQNQENLDRVSTGSDDDDLPF